MLAGCISGLIGVMIIEKKQVMVTGGIAHTSFGGVGFAFFVGIEPIIGAFLISLLSSFGIGTLKRKANAKADLAIGLFWALGMALGIIFIALTPGYPPTIQSFLFGNILSINTFDLTILAGTTILIIIVMLPYLKFWKLYAYDEEYAKIQGLNIFIMDYVFFFLIGIAVVSLIKVIGLIMVIALFTAPTAIAELYTTQFEKRMLLTAIISVFTSWLGIVITYRLELPTGAMIIILLVSFFLLSLAFKKMKKREIKNKMIKS